MAKRKEIKFRRDGKMFCGQQNGVRYSIHKVRHLHETESEQYYVSVIYPNGQQRSFNTSGYRTFDLDGAKEFCQQVAAGEFDPTPLFEAQDNAKAEQEKAALEHATKQASEFQSKLDAHNITYSSLLDLFQHYEMWVGDRARALLSEWEQLKGGATTEQDDLYHKIMAGIESNVYGHKEQAHTGPFQQDMVAYITEKGSFNTAQASQIFVWAFTNRNTLYGVLQDVDELLDLMLNLRADTSAKEVSV